MKSIALGLLLVLSASDPALPPEQMVRAAREDAQRRLAQKLKSLRVDAKLTLAECLDAEERGETALLPVARRARDIGTPIVYTDQAVELHLILPPADVRDEVRSQMIRLKKSPVAIRSALDALSDTNLAECTLAAGFALPQAPAESAVEHRSDAAVADMTTAAAILDTRRQLVDKIAALRLKGRSKVEEVLLQTPGLEDELLKSIPISVFGPTRRKAAGTMEVAATMSAQHAVDLVRECMQRLNPAADPPTLELESSPDDTLSVRGIGVQPSQATLVRMGLATSESGDAQSSSPAWANQCLTAEGTAEVAGGDDRTTAAVATAREDAEFDARRRLAEKIDTLKMPDGRAVREVLLNRKIVKDDLSRFLSGAHRIGMADATPDGRVRVVMQLPMAGLWRLIAAMDDPGIEKSNRGSP